MKCQYRTFKPTTKAGKIDPNKEWVFYQDVHELMNRLLDDPTVSIETADEDIKMWIKEQERRIEEGEEEEEDAVDIDGIVRVMTGLKKSKGKMSLNMGMLSSL